MSQLTPTKIYGPREVNTKRGVRYVYDIYFKGVEGKCSYFSETENQSVFTEGVSTEAELIDNGEYKGKKQYLINVGKKGSPQKKSGKKSPADMSVEELKDAIYRGKSYLSQLEAELASRSEEPQHNDDLPF